MRACNDKLVNLINRCTLRDQEAFKELYQEVSPLLHAVANRILRSDALSCEVIQDSFVQIWNNAETYRSDRAKALTWMCSIVRYRAIDKLKAERKHQQRTDYLDEQHELDQLPSEHTPEEEVALQQLSAVVNKHVDTLSANSRRSIHLAYFQDCSREEIAETMGANVNTVKSWLHRGIGKLKTCQEINVDIAT